MPYASDADLPETLHRHMPRHGRDIWRAAFNAAWRRYGAEGDPDIEATAHRIAWAAVKRGYRKDGDDWVPR